MMSTERALQMIDDFETSERPSAWKQIRDRGGFASQLRERVNDPFSISQGSSGTCGPATLVFNMLRAEPVNYVTLATSLFNFGGATLRKWQLRPDKELRDSACPSDIAEADWIVLASIRDSENWFFDFLPSTRAATAAGTTLSEIEDWFYKTGYTDVKRNQIYVNIQHNTKPNLKESLDLYNKNYQVVWFICASCIDSEIPDSINPNHVVVLAGDFTPPMNDTAQISIPIFTWGKKMNLPRSGGLNYGQFLDQYYGYVAGKL
jgi:hypothetical protein